MNQGLARRAVLWTLLAACLAATASAGGPESSRGSAGHSTAGPAAPAVLPASVLPGAGAPAIGADLVVAPLSADAAAEAAAPAAPAAPAAQAAASAEPASASAARTAAQAVAAELEQGRDGAQGAESAKSAGDALFDHAAARSSDAATPAAAQASRGQRGAAALKRWLGLGPRDQAPKTPFDRDRFGGPARVELDAKRSLTHGMRWGLTLTGLSTAFELVLSPLVSLAGWPGNLPDSWLPMIGRSELLASAGPKLIETAMTAAPLKFLLVAVPLSTIGEEIMYRGVSLGLWFVGLALFARGARALAGFVGGLPEFMGVGEGTGPVRSLVRVVTRGRVQNASLLGGLHRTLAWLGRAGWVFPAAAAVSAFGFASAHFGAWGISPVLIVTHAALGYALAHIVYSGRGWGLLTSVIAHYTYNALGLLAVWAALTSPVLGVVYSLSLTVVSLAAMYWHWRAYRKARGEAVAQARLRLGGGAAALAAAMIAGAALLGGPSADRVSAMMPRQNVAQPLAWKGAADALKTQAAPQAPQAPKGPQATPQQPPSDAKPKPKKPHAEADEDADEKAALEQFMKMFGMSLPKDPATLAGMAKVTAQAKNSVAEVRNPGHGLGSGWIADESGLLVTNNHVIDGAKDGNVLIIFPDGSRYKAKVVAANKGKDIAIVQLPPKEGGWKPLKIADFDQVSEGDEVLAMGHPRGLEFTVTRGIISGLGGTHRRNLYVRHLQTDASINPGNSGGPLVSMNVEVVGMNTQILTGGNGSNGSIGLGFAITSADIKNAIAQYKAIGNIDSGWLGIIVNAKDPRAPEIGIELEAIRPDSPAAKGGLKPGDVLLGVDGNFFASGEEAVMQLASVLAHSHPGRAHTFAVGRDGDVSYVTVTAGSEKF